MLYINKVQVKESNKKEFEPSCVPYFNCDPAIYLGGYTVISYEFSEMYL